MLTIQDSQEKYQEKCSRIFQMLIEQSIILKESRRIIFIEN